MELTNFVTKVAAFFIIPLVALLFCVWLFAFAPDNIYTYIEKGETLKFKLALFGARDVNRVCNEQLYEGCTPLHAAVSNNKIDYAKYLLAKKANVNAKVVRTSNTPLHLLANSPAYDKAMIRLLVKNGANFDEPNNDGRVPLQLAILNAKDNLVRDLIDEGASSNIKTGNGESCLHLAANVGNVNLISYFLDKGCSPNEKDTFDAPPLFHACRKGHYEASKCLVERGAQINHSTFQWKDKEYKIYTTPLSLAMASKNETLVSYLKSKGGRVLEKTRDWKGGASR